MLDRFFGPSRAPHAPEADVRIYAIGDIHGRYDLLSELLDIIINDPSEKPKQLVFLGDYVDRGPDSAGVVGRLATWDKSEAQAVFLKGNHEAAMLSFLDAPEKTIPGSTGAALRRSAVMAWQIFFAGLRQILPASSSAPSSDPPDIYQFAFA